jgi:hypothetical protein
MNTLRQTTLTAALALCVASLATPANAAENNYDPKIDPAQFTTEITHPLFSMPVGKEMVLKAKSEDGEERIEIRIRGETREIMGVKTLVYSDRVFLAGQLIEETSDYIAQDKDGNVWYFGEEVDNYEDGKLKDHHGAWIAGVDGAKPGIWMTAKQEVGREYRQEYYKGEAEDWAKVVATDATVKVPAGSFKDCTKIYEWTPLEPDSKAHKYYCAAAGGLVLEEELGDGKRVELVELK